MPINETQESDIRDFLSIVGIYFQFDDQFFKDFKDSDLDVLERQKDKCRESYEALVSIMSKVNPAPQELKLRIVPPVSYMSFGKAILDKFGYELETADIFLNKILGTLNEKQKV